MDQLTLLRNRYLNLLESSLTGTLHRDPNIDYWHPHEWNPITRYLGRDSPSRAQTMIGTARMQNLRYCCETVLRDEILGDFMECGIWRGGACIFMRGILQAYDVSDRVVFAADSFQGLPPPDPENYPADKGGLHHEVEYARISLEEVQENFRRYGLLDDRVVFLKGWFRETLPEFAYTCKNISVLRLDGDMYESTIQALENLYPKVPLGGFVIIDDYNLPECKKALEHYISLSKSKEQIFQIDGCGVYWRKNEF